MNVRSTVFAAAAVSAMALGASSAQAGVVFQVDPSALAFATEAPFLADQATFTYRAAVDQAAVGGVGTFSEYGAGEFTGYLLNGSVLGVGTTGINLSHRVYAVFQGTGTVAPASATSLGLSFNSFTVELYASDENPPAGVTTTITLNDAGANPAGSGAVAGDQDGFSGLPAGTALDGPGAGGAAFTLGNTAEDVLIAKSTAFIVGSGNVNTNFNAGDFAVSVDMTPVDVDAGTVGDQFYISLPFSLSLNFLARFSGNNNSFVGFSTETFDDGALNGAGIMEVPTPGALALFGSGLLTLGAIARRRRKAA